MSIFVIMGLFSSILGFIRYRLVSICIKIVFFYGDGFLFLFFVCDI